jgi:transcriptional regulator with GAF, ATPase, and Fis domain
VRALVPDCMGLSVAALQHGLTFTLVASSEDVAVLDAVQYLAGGPCVEGVKADQVIEFSNDDVLDEHEWRLFAQCTADAAVASTLTLPVLAAGSVVGSINLYAASANAFTGHHEQLARVFDAWAPGAVVNADLSFSTRRAAERAPRQLRDDRDIQVAVGILAASLAVDPEAARDKLRDAAQRAGASEVELAISIIEARRNQESE